ncbi:MAG: aspartyl protease family protein, partial [Isosphaeraceae bacterium]
MVKLSSLLASLVLTVMIALVAAHAGQKPGPGNEDHDPQIGRSFQVPYRLTDTNHFLVRVRINSKGPFNFLVDSGAPALFIATETAKKVGLKAARDRFWTPVDRFDIEGGA